MDLRKDVYFYPTLASFPASGSLNVLYVDRSSGIIYSWDGSSYIASGPGPVPVGLNYQGLWDANANSPLITSGDGVVGDYYIVGTAGTTNIDGINDWGVGDWIIFSSTGVWQKIDNSETSVSTIYTANGTLSGNRTVTMAGNTLNFSGGNVGVNIAPTVPLHVRGTAVPSVNEELLKLEVSDSNAYFSINNSSTVNGEFVPQFIGRQSASSVLPATIYGGIIDSTQDSGTEPVSIFRSFLSSLAAVTTRPVFQFKNWATDLMTVLANGNVGIGTITPTEKLEVSGKTKTTTFQMTTSPVNGYVLTSDASGNGTWSAAAGGLTNFTEAANSSAPNATVPVNSLTATGAATNIDVAIVPKGTGAFTLDIADNTTAGGNKRGANAIDLSTKRTNAADVASGASSIVIGETARATNTSSFAVGLGGTGAVSSGNSSIAMGAWTTATGNISFAVGNRVDATGLHSVSIGGYQYGATTASGESSFASGGATASGDYSLAIGPGNIANGRHSVATGTSAHTFGISGRQSHCAGIEATTGDSQTSKFILRERTTGNTATTLTSDSNAGGTANQVILSNNAAYGFTGTIVGKQSGSTNAVMWKVEGLIARGANAASTVLTTSTVTLVSNAPAWGTPTLAADTTNGGLRVQVVGAAATNIQWTAVIETTEVIYA